MLHGATGRSATRPLKKDIVWQRSAVQHKIYDLRVVTEKWRSVMQRCSSDCHYFSNAS